MNKCLIVNINLIEYLRIAFLRCLSFSLTKDKIFIATLSLPIQQTVDLEIVVRIYNTGERNKSLVAEMIYRLLRIASLQ